MSEGRNPTVRSDANEAAPPSSVSPHARSPDDLRVQELVLDLQGQELTRAAQRYHSLAKSYAALFEAIPSAALELSDTFGVVRCNQRARETLAGVATGASLRDFVADQAAREQLEALLNFAQKSGRANGDWEIFGRSYRVEVVVTGEAPERRLLVCLSDVSEAQRVQREAEYSAEQLRAILGASRDGVVVLHNTEVLYANEAWLALTSERSPLLGSVFDEVLDGTSLAERLWLAAQNEAPQAIDVRLGEGTANEVLAELTAVQVEYEGRTCALVTARDITARRRLEAQVARDERLTSLGMLVAGVAHEINNPLTYVLGNLECLSGLAETSGNSEAEQMLRDTVDGCQRIAGIIRELRSFYRSDEQHVRLLDLNQVARDAARFVAPKCALVAQVELDLGEVLPIAGVQNSLVQILINLLVNAIEAMPAREAHENIVRVRTGCRGRDVRIEVADNGRGIPAAELTRIFEPFFSRGKANGSGLGLTISRNLIEQMNGWIDVDSRVGSGTRFILHFEAAASSLVTSSSLPPASAAAVSTHAIGESRILVVDDEPLVARSVARLLASAREVRCVSSVAAALDALANRPEIDIVISDWVMPDGGAPRLIAELEARGQGDVPVVIMTGLGQLGTLERGERQCIAKPVSRGTLMQAVARALSAARHEQELPFGGPESAQFPTARRIDDPTAKRGSA